ncbi:hypothetical protein ABVT39_014352 [Epinephelus coioides]
MSYNDILVALARRHRIIISRSTLLRILKNNRLSRRKDYADLGRVIDFIQEQLHGPGKMHGYRWMFTKCKENGLKVKKEEISLRTTHGDDLSGERSYIAGASTANQRIESWWGILRKEGMEYWIQLLGELRDEGSFNGGVPDKAILQLCVMGLIQEELNNIKDVWNAHRIRPTSNPNVLHGIPNVMYSTPEL